MAEEEEAQEALGRLVVDNRDLEQLEAILSQFNLFEALGIVRRELRHSDMLGFLLDPAEAHGLGDHFLRRLLQRSLHGSPSQSHAITPVLLDVSELDEADVRREWSGIDILVLNERNRLAVIIENKIDSSEHSEQLHRYWELVRMQFPTYGIIALYLTPDGEAPSDERYVSINYNLIANLLDEVVATRASTLGPDVRVLLTHYIQVLRRHIVSDSEIAELCRRIYRKHRRALDLILEHRPDQQQQVRDLLEQLIDSTAGLVLDECTKACIRFAPSEWNHAALMGGSGWTKTGRMLMFEFQNRSDKLTLKLYIGPGPNEVRTRLFGMGSANPKLFVKAGKSLAGMWTQLFAREFLTSRDYDSEDGDDVTAAIKTRFESFKTNDLPLLLAEVRAQAWLKHDI